MLKKLNIFIVFIFAITVYKLIAAEAGSAISSPLKLLEQKEFKIREQQEPFRFRILKNVNLSGSSQFSKDSLKEIIKKIREHNKSVIALLDVRQEMHLLGDNDLSHIIAEKDWSEINHKLEFITKDEDAIVQSGLVEREETVAKNLDLKYLRVSVTDGTIPTDKAVDSFIEFYKEQIQNDPNIWFHIHCEHGHGRTTTFMTLVHILNTKGKTKLSDILDEQHKCGDVDLSFPPKNLEKIKDIDLQKKRFAFLVEFHQYVNDEENGFFADKLWSQWKKVVSES